MNHSLQSLTQACQQQLASLNLSPHQIKAETAMLLKACCAADEATVISQAHRPVAPEVAQQLMALLEERISTRTPIQYLLGEAWFYGLRFVVSPAVLIPRPETELLVEDVLAYCATQPNARVLDLCTGSGCIALAVAAHTPNSVALTACDLSPEALAVAQQNAMQLGLAHRVTWLQGDLFAAVTSHREDQHFNHRFDGIVSNPPYICPGQAGTLAPEVAGHEPAMALFSDEGPLAFYQRIAAEAPAMLAPGGRVWLELGEDCANGAVEAFAQAGFVTIRVDNDLAGLPRVLSACWRGQ